MNISTFTFTEPNLSQGNEENMVKNYAPKRENEGEDAQKWRKKHYVVFKK